MSDYFKKAKSLFSTTLSVGISTGTSETISLASVVGLPTDTQITLTLDRVDADGTSTPSKTERITGNISGSTLITYTRGMDDSTEQAHSAGCVIEYIWNAKDLNDIVDGILIEHAQTGAHTKATGAEINTGTEESKLITPKGLADSAIPTPSSTTTFTNKRINPRIITAASYTTDTGTALDVSTCDEFDVTAQAGALLFNAPGGTPVNGQKLIITVTDNGTARALTWNAVFIASTDLALPSTTVLSKTLYCGFIYNSTKSKWILLALLNNI